MRTRTSTSLHRGLAALGALTLMIAALSIGALLFGARSARAAVNVALDPASDAVAPGSDFDVFLDIVAADAGFNGFNALISYDPGVLALVPASPTKTQEGCLVTGACSGACGQTFHQFSAAGDSIAVSDVLLCNQVSIAGPGHLYRLRFHALAATPLTRVRILRARFYDAGIEIMPVTLREARVAIGGTTGVGGGPAAPSGLRVEPNPASGRVSFVADAERDGWAEADVLDLQGRVVRHLGPVWLGAHGSLEWDRADARGVRVPAGVYMVRVHRGDATRDTRFVLLQ